MEKIIRLKKKLVGLVILISIVALGSLAGPAGAAFYNFDNLIVPGPSPLVLTGVTLTPGPGVIGGVAADANAPSEPNTYTANLVQPLPGTTTLLTISFVQPVFVVKFQMYRVGFYDSITVNALDGSGNLVDSQGFTTAVAGVYDLPILCAKGIKSLVIRAAVPNPLGSVRVAMDNFSFSRVSGAAVIPLN